MRVMAGGLTDDPDLLEAAALDTGIDPAVTIAGFNPPEPYETAIANLAPELTRRPSPESVANLLAWAGEPLATAEIVMVTGLPERHVRGELSRIARAIPVGADAYWILPAT